MGLNNSTNNTSIIITDKEFELLSKFIKFNYGINLKEEKKSLVMGRLQTVLYQKNMKSFSEYYEYISSDKTGKGVSDLINRITTNHTFFMRESIHFDFFKDKVLPKLKETVHDRDLRIWSAGCSSGEEPYTLAMLIDNYFGREKLFWNTEILATDISSQVLKIAKNGVYTNERIEPIPYEIRTKYFKRINNESSEVVEAIKKEVTFARLNLMNKSFPFTNKFHAIFCRNVMIYFNMEILHKLDINCDLVI